MSSVDVSGVSSTPLLSLWGNPVCCSNRSFHSAVQVQKNTLTERNEQIKFTSSFFRGLPGMRARKGRVCDEWKRMFWWAQIGNSFALIRLDYCHTPGFETFRVTSLVQMFRWVQTEKSNINRNGTVYCCVQTHRQSHIFIHIFHNLHYLKTLKIFKEILVGLEFHLPHAWFGLESRLTDLNNCFYYK